MFKAYICHDCHLASEGFSAEELGIDGDFDTTAIHYRVDPVNPGETIIGTCNFCGARFADVAEVTCESF